MKNYLILIISIIVSVNCQVPLKDGKCPDFRKCLDYDVNFTVDEVSVFLNYLKSKCQSNHL